jgi:predicted dehydrogenase
MDSPLNVALIGYGYAGKTFHAPLIASVDGLHLHTVVSSDAAKVAADFPDARVVADAGDAFADDAIDLVVIATPNVLHAPQALAALMAGKHVVVDKPFAVTLAEAHAVADEAKRRDRVLSVFHNRRWDADFLTVKRLIDARTLGDIVHFESHFDRYRPLVRDRWRERPGAGSGAWFDLGSHLVDQALQLFGKPQAITLDTAAQREGALTDDYFHALLRYPRHRVVLHASALVASDNRRFTVHGTTGSFIKHGLDPQEDALKAGVAPGTRGWGIDPAPGTLVIADGDFRRTSLQGGDAGDYRRYYERVRDAILGRGANPVPDDEALAVMRVLDAGDLSTRERREIAL